MRPLGCSSTAPNEPASRLAKYSSAKRTRPMAGSSSWPSWNSSSMFMPMWKMPKCKKPDETKSVVLVVLDEWLGHAQGVVAVLESAEVDGAIGVDRPQVDGDVDARSASR